MEFEIQTDEAEDSETTEAVSPGTCFVCGMCGCVPF